MTLPFDRTLLYKVLRIPGVEWRGSKYVFCMRAPFLLLLMPLFILFALFIDFLIFAFDAEH